MNGVVSDAVVFQVSGSGSGHGGAPLTMREVEELEKMTKDFIKDMDKHPPVITSPATGTQTLSALLLHTNSAPPCVHTHTLKI